MQAYKTKTLDIQTFWLHMHIINTCADFIGLGTLITHTHTRTHTHTHTPTGQPTLMQAYKTKTLDIQTFWLHMHIINTCADFIGLGTLITHTHTHTHTHIELFKHTEVSTHVGAAHTYLRVIHFAF